MDRVRSALDIDRTLCTPPRAVERDGTLIGEVPALRFPIWMRCLNPKCGLLHHAPWRNRRAEDDGPRPTETRSASAGGAGECSDCGGRLEQTPWVLVHEDGYLADIPRHDLVHRDIRDPELGQCRPDWT